MFSESSPFFAELLISEVKFDVGDRVVSFSQRNTEAKQAVCTIDGDIDANVISMKAGRFPF
jgi:hypothetical protein